MDINEFITSYTDIVDVIIRQQFRPRSYNDYEELYSCGLVALWKAHSSYNKYKSQINTYVWIIIQREIISYLKQKQRWKLSSLPDEYDFANPQCDKLKDFMPNLTQKEKAIIKLRIEGYSLKEIAEAFDCTPQAIRYQIKKIINIIKEANDIE